MTTTVRQPSLFGPQTPEPPPFIEEPQPFPGYQGLMISFGYSTPGADALLTRLMADSRTLLCDLRLSPYAPRSPQWHGSSLQRQYGSRYRHFPCLGNTAYRQPGSEIRLADPDAGVPQLAAALRRGHLLVLLCTCPGAGCHRYEVVRRVQAVLPHAMMREASEAFCQRCEIVLDGQARGSWCVFCWTAHVRAILPRNEGRTADHA